MHILHSHTQQPGAGTWNSEGLWGEVVSLREPRAPSLPPHLSQHLLALPRGPKAEAGLGGSSCPDAVIWPQSVWALVYLPVTWSSSLPQTWSSLPATGVYCFATLALALLVLLEALAHVDTQKLVRAQCGVHPTACYSIRFLQLPALPPSHCLQSP